MSQDCLLVKARSLGPSSWHTMILQLFFTSTLCQGLGPSFLYRLMFALILFSAVVHSQTICTVFAILSGFQVIFFFSDRTNLISVLVQLLSVGSFTEDRLFNFTGGSPSRRPDPGPFSSAHHTCNLASRSFLTTSHIDVSFLALSTICNYVFIPVFICSMSLPLACKL